MTWNLWKYHTNDIWWIQRIFRSIIVYCLTFIRKLNSLLKASASQCLVLDIGFISLLQDANYLWRSSCGFSSKLMAFVYPTSGLSWMMFYNNINLLLYSLIKLGSKIVEIQRNTIKFFYSSIRSWLLFKPA